MKKNFKRIVLSVLLAIITLGGVLTLSSCSSPNDDGNCNLNDIKEDKCD